MTNPSLREALEAVLLVYPDLATAKEIGAARSEAIRALAAAPEHEAGGPLTAHEAAQAGLVDLELEGGRCPDSAIIISIELNRTKPARPLHARFDAASHTLQFESHSEFSVGIWDIRDISSAAELWKQLMKAKREHEAERRR